VYKWDIQKNIEEEEKWALKRGELVKETKENKIYCFKWSLVRLSKK